MHCSQINGPVVSKVHCTSEEIVDKEVEEVRNWNIYDCTLVYLEEMILKLVLCIFIKLLIMASSVLNSY